MCRVEKAQLAHDVLAYLVAHADAQDTLEGITEWWLVEQEIQYHATAVKEAVGDLVDQQLLIQRRGLDSRYHYRLNPDKESEIQTLLQQATSPEPTSPAE
jgi:hypothetical protein